MNFPRYSDLVTAIGALVCLVIAEGVALLSIGTFVLWLLASLAFVLMGWCARNALSAKGARGAAALATACAVPLVGVLAWCIATEAIPPSLDWQWIVPLLLVILGFVAFVLASQTEESRRSVR